MDFIQNCAVNRVAIQHDQDVWRAIKPRPILGKRKAHRRYPQAIRKRGRNGLGRSPPRKWRKLSHDPMMKIEGGGVSVPSTNELQEIPRIVVPQVRRPNITLEAWGNLNTNERLMPHQYPKTVRDVLLLPNVHKEGDCPPGTYLPIWSAEQVKSLLLDTGKIGQNRQQIMMYLEPLETLSRSRIEEYMNTHTKKQVYDLYYFKAHSLVVNPLYRTMEDFYDWVEEEMN